MTRCQITFLHKPANPNTTFHLLTTSYNLLLTPNPLTYIQSLNLLSIQNIPLFDHHIFQILIIITLLMRRWLMTSFANFISCFSSHKVNLINGFELVTSFLFKLLVILQFHVTECLLVVSQR